MTMSEWLGPFCCIFCAYSMQLGTKLLERRYLTNTIRYYDIERDYRPLPQVTHNDYVRMARALLLYILCVYHFTNGGANSVPEVAISLL